MSVVLPALAAWARADPDRSAIVCNDERLTYADLFKLVTAVRQRFAALGVEPGRTAAVLITNRAHSWVVHLALQSLGLDTLQIGDVSELETLKLPGLSYVATRTAWPDRLRLPPAASVLRHVNIRPLERDDLPGDLDRLELPVGGAQLMSTSGTTGLAKLVRFEPAMQAIRAEAHGRLMQFGPDSVVYVGRLPLWTSVGVADPIAVWLAGGTVVLDQNRPRRTAFRPGRGELLTHAMLTVPALAEVLGANEDALTFNPGLKLIIGASALPWRMAKEAMRRLTPHLFARLGATETGTVAITPVNGPGDQLAHAIDPSRRVEAVDDGDRPLPTGSVGRLRIRLEAGDIASYVGEEAGAGAQFRDGWFYPGDLAAVGSDGRLRLHGRANDVINLRGMKIPTLPIEQAALAAVAARDACLLIQTGPDGEDETILVLEIDRPLIDAEVRGVQDAAAPLRPNLHRMDAFPRNEMGKVDRNEMRRRLTRRQAASHDRTLA